MKNKVYLLFIPILLTITLAMPEVYPSLNLLSQETTYPALNRLLNDQQPLKTQFKKYVDPELSNATEPTRIILFTANDDLASITEKMLTTRITPSIGGPRMLLGVADAKTIQYLVNRPETMVVLKDRRIEYSKPTDIQAQSSLLKGNLLAIPLKKSKFVPTDEPLIGEPETTLREAVDIIGAQKAWTDLGIVGANTTVAIVDTGVDYSALSMGYWDAIARDDMGNPAAFDADASGLALANTTVTATHIAGGRKYLETSGIDPEVYFSLGPWLNTALVIKFSNLTGSSWTEDMEITGITSKSGTYHFGVACQWWNIVPEWLISQIFPVLIVDSAKAGVYDTVYVDLSYDWAWLGLFSSENPDILPYWPSAWPPEFSFADETPINKSHPLAARDFNGDGIYDLSAGALGYFLDIWSASPNIADRSLILKPLDPAGNYVVLVNDWLGHGTFCASAAAGRDFTHPLSGSGAAPAAKVMGVTALFLGDIIEGELWAAGFDLIPGTEGWQNVPSYGTVYGTWQYTGNHKADIISNSWGISEWAPWLQQQLLPWYDVLSMLEDALMVPGYLDPDYPGTVIIHSSGNGGPGHGTVTSPAFATLPITVGATTSLNTTSKTLFGLAGGRHNDVISWSARGPTPIGNVKPDIVNIGAWAWTAGPTWLGNGDGSKSFDAFGGTSMSAPLTAGVAALTVQAYQQAYQVKPSPETVKILLKSSAEDLGYDPFVQGAGRIDAFASVRLASSISGIQISSPATWENVRKKIEYSWTFYRSIEESQQNRFVPPQGPINDFQWFAGTVSPAESTASSFVVENPMNETVRVTIRPVRHRLITTETYANQTEKLLDIWQTTNLTWGNLLLLDKASIPEEADFMVVSVSVPYEDFDPDGDYIWNQRCGVFILDWIDRNNDSKVDPDESYNLNYGYNYGTTSEARVGFPNSRIQGQPVILIYQRNQTEDLRQMPFQVSIAYYSKDIWDWIETPEELNVEGKSSTIFNASIIIPEGVTQGVYEGQIEVSVEQPYNKTMMIPVSLQVSAALSGESLTYNFSSSPQIELYDPYRVSGYFDWNWRYESGDWKQWVFDIQDREVVKAFVTCDWAETKTDIDMFTISSLGFLTDASVSPYLESGRFRWNTRTEITEDYAVLDASWIYNPLPGTYTVLLHTVLFDGKSFPEEVSGKVQLVKLSPRGSVSLKAKPGQTVSQNFTIATGRQLTDLVMFGFSIFQVHVAPDELPQLDAEESATFEVKIDVPEDTPEGTYVVVVAFAAQEFPDSPAYGIINLSVDNSTPKLNVLSPQNKSIVAGSIAIEAYAEDSSGIQNVNFTVGTVSSEMIFDKVTGHYTLNVSPTELFDGQYTIDVTATDKAGNAAKSSVTLTVDNTQPIALINAPLNNTYHTATVLIEVTGQDTNLDRMELYGNDTMLAEWVSGGTHTHAWNTTNYPDGVYTLLLKVYDKAFHGSQSQIIIISDNTSPTVLVSSPENQTIVKGTSELRFSAWDEHLLNVSLIVDDRTPFNATGLDSVQLDTKNMTDGPHVLRLSATDLLGNEAETSTSIIVDNTQPIVHITSPANQTKLSGVAAIQFSAQDQNLHKIFLYVDQAAFDVTGQASHQWDTNKVGDGIHAIRLIATDQAGNQAEEQISITTNNVEMATEQSRQAGYQSGINFGFVVGAVGGFIIGVVAIYIVIKRTKSK